MFYSHTLLCRRTGGRFSLIWYAATHKKISPSDAMKINIEQSCEGLLEIIQEESSGEHRRFSLYLSSMLLYGTCLVHNQQVSLFLDELMQWKRMLYKNLTDEISLTLGQKYPKDDWRIREGEGEDEERRRRKRAKKRPIADISQHRDTTQFLDIQPPELPEPLSLSAHMMQDASEITLPQDLPIIPEYQKGFESLDLNAQTDQQFFEGVAQILNGDVEHPAPATARITDATDIALEISAAELLTVPPVVDDSIRQDIMPPTEPQVISAQEISAAELLTVPPVVDDSIKQDIMPPTEPQVIRDEPPCELPDVAIELAVQPTLEPVIEQMPIQIIEEAAEKRPDAEISIAEVPGIQPKQKQKRKTVALEVDLDPLELQENLQVKKRKKNVAFTNAEIRISLQTRKDMLESFDKTMRTLDSHGDRILIQDMHVFVSPASLLKSPAYPLLNQEIWRLFKKSCITKKFRDNEQRILIQDESSEELELGFDTSSSLRRTSISFTAVLEERLPSDGQSLTVIPEGEADQLQVQARKEAEEQMQKYQDLEELVIPESEQPAHILAELPHEEQPAPEPSMIEVPQVLEEQQVPQVLEEQQETSADFRVPQILEHELLPQMVEEPSLLEHQHIHEQHLTPEKSPKWILDTGKVLSELEALWNANEGVSTFQMLCPHDSTTKFKAASIFSLLLELARRRRLHLKQDLNILFGTIYIYRRQ